MNYGAKYDLPKWGLMEFNIEILRLHLAAPCDRKY